MLTRCRTCWTRKRDVKRRTKKELKRCTCCGFERNEDFEWEVWAYPLECTQPHPDLVDLHSVLLRTTHPSIHHLATGEAFPTRSQIPQPPVAFIISTPQSSPPMIMHLL